MVFSSLQYASIMRIESRCFKLIYTQILSQLKISIKLTHLELEEEKELKPCM